MKSVAFLNSLVHRLFRQGQDLAGILSANIPSDSSQKADLPRSTAAFDLTMKRFQNSFKCQNREESDIFIVCDDRKH